MLVRMLSAGSECVGSMPSSGYQFHLSTDSGPRGKGDDLISPTWESSVECWLLASALPSPSLFWHLGLNQQNTVFSVSLTLKTKHFFIRKNKLKLIVFAIFGASNPENRSFDETDSSRKLSMKVLEKV